MRKLSFISSIFISLFLVFGCENPAEEVQQDFQNELSGGPNSDQASKITGSVQVEWKGKGGSGMVVEKLVLVNFDAHEAVGSKLAKGSFTFSVWKSENELEREIVAKVMDVGFGNSAEKKGWFFAEVISDTKCDSEGHTGGDGCSDSGNHEEGDGCSDSGDHEDGDTTHDGGCSHDDTGTVEESCGGGGTDMGGEGEDGTMHDDTGTEHEEGMGGKPDDKGGKGKQCRVGQYVVVKTHDKGSPGTNDGITWKWFDSLDGFSIESEPQKLCKKTILAGNLVVHIAKTKK